MKKSAGFILPAAFTVLSSNLSAPREEGFCFFRSKQKENWRYLSPYEGVSNIKASRGFAPHKAVLVAVNFICCEDTWSVNDSPLGNVKGCQHTTTKQVASRNHDPETCSSFVN
jgi:hypothetical protein